MARPKKAVPSYRRHKATGQAVVTIEGRDHYLGPFGSRESREHYARLGAEARSGITASSPRDHVAPLTVRSLVARYWRRILAEGRYMKRGVPTGEREWLRRSFRPLVRLYGRTPVAEFGPQKLQAFRSEIARGEPRKNGSPRRPLARTTVNSRVRRIKQLFRWGVAQELVPPSVIHGLDAVRGLRKGESAAVREPKKVRPVADEHVHAIVKVLPPVLGDVGGDGDPDLVVGNYGRNRLYLNLLRQLDVPFLVKPGKPYQLDVYAPSRPMDLAVVMLSGSTMRVSLPPFGTFALDPTQLVALPAFAIPQPAGVASVSLPVPNNPRLVGLPIYAQAFLVQNPLGAYLTNWTADVIVQ